MSADGDARALEHMIGAARSILSAMKGKKRAFAKDTVLQDAVIRRFEIMGEAARRLSRTFMEAHPDVPWKRIIGLRNFLIHAYDKVRVDEVLQVVEDTLPHVVRQLEALRTNG